MSTGQSYVGGGPHANTAEQTVKKRPIHYPSGPLTSEEVAEFKAKSKDGLPKSGLSISLAISTQSLIGPSSAETIIFALQAYHEQMLEETGDAVSGGIDSVHDAHFAYRHAQNASRLLVDLTLALAKQTQTNHWAATMSEQQYVRHFLQQTAQGEQDKAELASTWMGVTYPQE